MSLIEVRDLRKTFHVRPPQRGPYAALRSLLARRRHEVRAVDGVSFEVGRGELVGYLGPNGAGKSTTLKMLTGLLVPSGGELRVAGLEPHRERRRYVARIGAVFGQRSTLWWDLPVRESLELLRHMYRVPQARFRSRLAEFDDLLDLAPFLDAPVRTLSLGQRMRADLTAALLHDPELLFLDEPTIGLDVVAKERIRRFVERVNRERGVTVLLTTHDLADVRRLCRRVMIIDRGRLLYDGDLPTLQERFGGRRRLVVDFADPVADPRVPGAEVLEHEDGRVVYAFDRRQLSASELIGRVSARFALRDLTVEEPDAEATVRAIYERGLLG